MSRPKRPRTQEPARTPGSGAAPRLSRRKPAEFSVPIKLWVSQEMYDALEAAAKEKEWSVPQVIRRAVRLVVGERKLD